MSRRLFAAAAITASLAATGLQAGGPQPARIDPVVEAPAQAGQTDLALFLALVLLIALVVNSGGSAAPVVLPL